LPQVEADQSMLEQLFQNLISNAIKYKRPTVPLTIRICGETVEGGWKFAVADNGEGIAGKYLESIFKPLKRLHGADIPGSGLGLAMCSAIVERHGGRIWVESVAGKGTTFFFTLSEASAGMLRSEDGSPPA
jgi:signal transduction histidine kinase